MMKSKTAGVAVTVAGIMVIVCFSVYKNSAAGPGITLRPTAGPAMAQSSVPTAASNQLTNTLPDKQAPDQPSPSTPPSTGSQAVATADSNPVAQAPVAEVVVHVAGAVKHPGVYHLHIGARNDDALKAAGGLAANANEASINLAALAVDGAQLYVMNQTEQPSGGAVEEGSIPNSSLGGMLAKAPASSHIAKSKSGSAARSTGGKPSKLKDPSEGKININTASSDELQRISGIGPAMAEKIIAYRQENHGFQSVDDLLQVSGIGAKKFAKMSPFVKIR